jgi:hypothetical protein
MYFTVGFERMRASSYKTSAAIKITRFSIDMTPLCNLEAFFSYHQLCLCFPFWHVFLPMDLIQALMSIQFRCHEEALHK